MAFWKRAAGAEPGTGPRVAGVIPSAGTSSRMGAPKALLDAGGRSFVAAVVGSLVGGGCHPVFVVVGPGQEDVERRARAAGASVLLNPEPGEGPITSLRLALVALPPEADGIAYCPVDHPLLRAETVARLLAEFRSGLAPVVLPTVDGRRGHPAVFRRTVFPQLTDPDLEGGARTVVHRLLDVASLVEVSDRGAVTDVDTPAAYRKALGALPADG